MNDMIVFSSDRQFKIWEYTGHHRQLLIRSLKSDIVQTRLDIVFMAVGFMALPPLLRGLRITECTTDPVDLPELCLDWKEPWYRIDSAEGVGYVAAGSIYTHEDDLDNNDPSQLMTGRKGPGRRLR
jgi:hypothetical protein